MNLIIYGEDGSPVHNEAFASDTYGTITLEQDTYGALMSEVIREGRSFSLKTK